MLQVEEIKHAATDTARKHGLHKVTLFGSYARGDATDASDVDLVVEASRPLGFARGAIYNELEAALQCPVDIIFGSANLYPFVRQEYDRDGVVLYEAQ